MGSRLRAVDIGVSRKFFAVARNRVPAVLSGRPFRLQQPEQDMRPVLASCSATDVRQDPQLCTAVAVILAVMTLKLGEDGWESNPHRTPQQRPANGFEDRGSCVHDRPPRSAGVRSPARTFHDHPPAFAVVRRVGCHLGCHIASITFGVSRVNASYLASRFRVRSGGPTFPQYEPRRTVRR
jgi:hypothetical protein